MHRNLQSLNPEESSFSAEILQAGSPHRDNTLVHMINDDRALRPPINQPPWDYYEASSNSPGESFLAEPSSLFEILGEHEKIRTNEEAADQP